MSGTSQAPKIGLDARTAALKEKLLRGRSRSHTRATPPQPSTDVARPDPDVAVGALSRTPSERVKPPASFVPHEVPQPPMLPSLPADANDIAALISSISSAAASETQDPSSTSTPSCDPTTQQKPPTRPTAPAAERFPLPPKPAPKISIAIPVTGAAKGKQAQQPDSKVATAFKSPSTTRSAADEHPEEGEVTATPLENGKTSASTVRAASRTSDYKSPAATTPAHGNGVQSFTVQSPTSRPESRREKNGPTPTKPSFRKAPCDNGNKPRTTAPKLEAPTEPTLTKNSARVDMAPPSGKNMGRSEQISPKDAFTRLLNQTPDLKDFLEMTDYYNVEARTRKLDRFRRAKALAAEKLRIEEEERMLMAEEELEMGLQRSTMARFTSAVPSAPSGPETNSLPTPVTRVPATIKGESKDTPDVKSTKRAHDGEDNTEARQGKVPRLEAPPPPPPRARDTDKKEHDRREDVRDARRDSRYHRSPSPQPRFYADDEYEDRRKPGRYKADDGHHFGSGRRRESGQHGSYPVRVDLGHRGDTRFFILKSFNEENVLRCMEDNLWTTQVQNGSILTEAFEQCRNVILFFSINKSRAFQGYARMASAPSPDTPRPTFVKGIHWDTSDPFRVQWLSKTAVEFYRIGHLKNPYNEHLPVLVGKDGQEIEEECGAELLREMEAVALDLESPRLLEGGGGSGDRTRRVGSRVDRDTGVAGEGLGGMGHIAGGGLG